MSFINHIYFLPFLQRYSSLHFIINYGRTRINNGQCNRTIAAPLFTIKIALQQTIYSIQPNIIVRCKRNVRTTAAHHAIRLVFFRPKNIEIYYIKFLVIFIGYVRGFICEDGKIGKCLITK